LEYGGHFARKVSLGHYDRPCIPTTKSVFQPPTDVACTGYRQVTWHVPATPESTPSATVSRMAIAAKRLCSIDASDFDHPINKRPRRVRWADGVDHGCASTHAVHTNSEETDSIEEIAATLSLLSEARVTLVRPNPDVRRCAPFGDFPAPGASSNAYVIKNAALEPAPSAADDLAKLAAVFSRAFRDFRASKVAVATAIAEGAPESTVDRLLRTANVMDALHRCAFENAFMLSTQVRALPPFVRERAKILAAVVLHNRAVQPGDMGLTPEFALHALRCARWAVTLDARGAARILPSIVVPTVRIVLWDHEKDVGAGPN
jgi:hypothetical protein